jgi:hypothetical protein
MSGADAIVCLGLTFHPGLDAVSRGRPWQLWLQSYAALRLSAWRMADGRLRAAVEAFASDGVEAADQERALLQSLAALSRDWEAPVLITLGGARAALGLLRLRSLFVGPGLAFVRAPFAAKARPRGAAFPSGAHLDLLEDEGLRHLRPPISISDFCDAIGLRFSATFEDVRHDPRAVAQLTAMAAAAALALRGAHDGVFAPREANDLVAQLRAEADRQAASAPWLGRLLDGFRLP